MKEVHKKLEFAANIAIVVIALTLVSLLAVQYLTPRATTANQSQNRIVENTKFNLNSVDWSKGEKNLVLAFSTKCRFCLESIALYKLVAQRKVERNDVRLIVVSPQPLEEVKSFFQERNITIDEFAQAQLSDISVSGTPTLVLVGRDGFVKGSWVGKLPSEEEEKLISRVFGDQGA